MAKWLSRRKLAKEAIAKILSAISQKLNYSKLGEIEGSLDEEALMELIINVSETGSIGALLHRKIRDVYSHWQVLAKKTDIFCVKSLLIRFCLCNLVFSQCQ